MNQVPGAEQIAIPYARRAARAVVRDGAWTGHPCFIIGGGESLIGFDFSRLAGKLTIGLNAAWKTSPTVSLVLDVRLMDLLHETPDYRTFNGAKLWLKTEPCRKYTVLELEEAGVGILPAANLWTTSLERGLLRLSNAGPAALNLAAILGASEINLLGFDLKTSGKKVRRWHDDYPPQWATAAVVLERFRKEIEGVAQYLDVPVYNLSPDSALTKFPKRTPEEAGL